MKTLRVLGGWLALLVAPGLLDGAPLRVKVTETTLQKRQSQTQNLPRGKSQLEEKKVACRFEIQPPIAAQGTSLTFEWTVLVEDAGGQLQRGTDGHQKVTFSNALPVVVESAPVILAERTWRGERRDGSVESSISGTGWRAWDVNGNLLGEGYDPPSVKAYIDWTRAGEAAPERDQEEEPPPRRIKRPRLMP